MKAAVFFDAGLTLLNVYKVGKPDMFRYFCKVSLPQYDFSNLDLLEGAKKAEIHFQLSHSDPEYQKSKSFWVDNYAHGLMGAGVSRDEACSLAPIIDGILGDIQKTYALISGVRETLEHLKETNCKLAVVSNWHNQSLYDILEDLGLVGYFDYIADSSKEGVFKPDARIFNVVLKKLGIERHQAIHVGDLYYSDVVGARNARIDTVLFDELRALEGLFDCKCIHNIKDIIKIATGRQE